MWEEHDSPATIKVRINLLMAVELATERPVEAFHHSFRLEFSLAVGSKVVTEAFLII